MSKITRGEKKSFLECMFSDLNDIHEGSDEEVKKELTEMGVDIEKAKKSFQKTLEACKNLQKRQRLEGARKSRLASKGRASDFLEMVHRKALSVTDLVARITELQPATAHREFESWSKEDLESQLADLLSLQGDMEKGE